MIWYPLLNGEPGEPPGPTSSSLFPILFDTVTTPAAEAARDTAASAADVAADTGMPAGKKDKR